MRPGGSAEAGSVGSVALMLLCCLGILLYCLHALSSGRLDTATDSFMRQRWQRAHVIPGAAGVAVHVPSRKKGGAVIGPV